MQLLFLLPLNNYYYLPFQTEMKQNAEVAAYFGRFEEAEKMYLEMDRK